MKRKTNKLLGLLFASLILFTILVGVVAMQQTAYAAAPKIQQVTLSDIQVPVVGDSLDSTYTVPAGAAYEKYVTSPKITWTKQSDPYAVSCAEGETVKAGATYYATVELHSKSDSPFDGANPITITVNTLHGSDAVDHKIVDTKYSLSHDNMVIEIKLTFRACSVYDYTFAFTNAPGVTHGMPKDGEHPWTAEDVVPVTQITDLNMLSLSWYRGSSQIYQQYTFQKENSYRLEFYLEDGFTAIIKPGTTIAYYDDETGLYFDGELGTDGIVKMEPTFKPIDPVLHEITLCGFTDPVADDTVQAHTKVWADTPMYGPEFALTGQTWHVSPSGGALPQSYTFEGNKSYFCEYILTPENGYSFDSSVKVTLKDRNGYAVTLDTVKLLSDGTLQIRTTSFDVVGGVDMVRVYDYIPPTVGMTASSCYPIISSSAPYEFSQRQWHNQTDNVNMSDSDVFEAGKSYYLNLTFKAKSGYSLSGATQITMTAKYTDGLVDMFSPSFISGVLVCSTKTEKAVRQAGTPVMYSLSYHNGIVVNGYRDPVAGDTAVDAADMLSVPDGDGYEVSFVRWVNEDFTALGKNVKLEAGKKYGLYVELAPLDGYYFAVEQNINNLHLYDAYTNERVTNTTVMWEGANERAFGQIPGTGNFFFYTYPMTAAELIDFVQVYLDEPEAGKTADYTASYPNGAHYYSANDIYLSDPDYNTEYLNDIMWDYTPAGFTFGNSSQHYLHMQITAKPGYAFPSDTRDIAVTFNQYDIHRYNVSTVTTSASNKLDIEITFDTSFRFEVAFATIDHGLAPVSQRIATGNIAKEPEVPTADGWVFEGWYTEPDFTNLYSFTAPVKEDITLYAKWKVPAGDLNGDGKINQKDLAMLSKYLRNKTAYPLGEDALQAADILSDGTVNQKDLAILSKYLRNPSLYPLP